MHKVFDITLKSGIKFINVKPTDSTESVIGLWIWSFKQKEPQVLSFSNGLSILSTEIAAIKEVI